MKSWRSLLLTCLALSLVLLCVPALLGQSTQQHTDDGYFNFYIYASAGSDGSVNAYASSPEPDSDLDYNSYTVEQPTWSLSGGNYRNSGQGSSISAGSLPLGASYDAFFEFIVVYEYENPYAGGDNNNYCEEPIYGGNTCRATDNIAGDVSLYIPAPPPVISSIDPAYALQGGQGSLTVSGSNFANYNGDQVVLHFSGGGSPFTLTSTQTPCTFGCTATFSYDVSSYAAGPSYTVWLSNNEAESEPVSFPIYLKSPTTSGPAPYSCAVSSNQAAGLTSIVPSGLTSGIAGTFSVTFGGGDFAGITPPQVNYGPSSTPESIAASMAALITRNYFRYGLSAKAFGSNLIYSGTSETGSATLGSVSNVFSGSGGSPSSFFANTSPATASEASMACESAPAPPAPANPLNPCAGVDPVNLGYDEVRWPNGQTARQHIITNHILEYTGAGKPRSTYGVTPLASPTPAIIYSRFAQVIGFNSLTVRLGHKVLDDTDPTKIVLEFTVPPVNLGPITISGIGRNQSGQEVSTNRLVLNLACRIVTSYPNNP